MKKRNLIIANWKMNPSTFDQSKKLFSAVNKNNKLKNTDIVVCPPNVYLHGLSKLKNQKNIFLGAQNVFYEEKGAYTGEVSLGMIAEFGVKFVIVGHSERRALGESDNTINKKIKTVFNHDLTPIICIGEKERDKEGEYLAFIKNQLKEDLSGLKKKDLLGLVIAYEPVWAIGKSYKESMGYSDIHEMVLFIKKSLTSLFGSDVANTSRILYGGSVEEENVSDIATHSTVDGFLVGHASLDPVQFGEILKIADIKK